MQFLAKMIIAADLESLVGLTCLVLIYLGARKNSFTTVLYLCFTWHKGLDVLEVFTSVQAVGDFCYSYKMLSLSISVTTWPRDNIPRSRIFGLVQFTGIVEDKKK